MAETRTLLLIDNDPSNADIFREALRCATNGPFAGEWVRTLAAGLKRLRRKGIWAVFVNLSLPDSRGLETFFRLSLATPNVPTLVLGGAHDEQIALEALRQGAKDYLLEGHIDSYSLVRAIRNMAERKSAEETLFTEQERAQVTLNSIGDAVLSTDIAGNVTYLNAAAETMTGWTREEAVGRPLGEVFEIIDGGTRKPSPSPLKLAIQENKTVGLSADCILVRRDGCESAIEDSAAPIHDRSGLVTGGVIVFHDVSMSRAMTAQMSYLAQHDTLTKLPNRVLLKDRVNQAISASHRHGTRVAVLFLDLDGFKHINDSLGHAIGDKLLQSVAERLLLCVRSSDTVSRQGGDEFVVLLTEITHADDAGISATKILNALIAPHDISSYRLRVTASIGVTTYPDDGHDGEILIKNADMAMYQAKKNGRNNYQFFEKDMNVRAIERQSVEGDLRHALERDEFLVHYQTKVDLQTGEITGVEALIRWRHPERGLLDPLQFISVAEDCGLIIPIGKWALRESCRQAQAWRDAGLPPIGVAVNVSSVELRNEGFLAGVQGILEDTRLEPRYLQLELTESVLMHHPASTVPMLRNLKAMGVGLALDDFGTGYSSLSYLRQFPIDTLKVDQSFVQEIKPDTDSAVIVSAVISMGKSLGQCVIAEGVETAEQLAFLRAQGCDEGQGYYFSRPIAATELAKLLEGGGLSGNLSRDQPRLPFLPGIPVLTRSPLKCVR
jgi:diguanylate cyclase (GGDEF)-like protein/PAS domain S-box-containing protein